MQNKPIGTIVRELYEAGAEAYRAAIAEQVRGKPANRQWDEWEADTAALLLIAWAAGAHDSIHAAGIKVPKPAMPSRFAEDEVLSKALMRFDPGPAREAVKRFVDLLPITRSRWDALIDLAFEAAAELRKDEAANALAKMLDRSPGLAELIRPALSGRPPMPVPGQEEKPLPKEVKRVRTPGVQAIAQGAFFVTGMNAEQAQKVKDLLAKVIKQETTVSVAGKKLNLLGVGDFIQQATLETGADLTAARLETVYRTNLNRAASQGQLDIVREPVVREFVPVMQFTATKDTRTRDTHRAMDGYVATVEQIDTQGINTPLGFNCRCAWKPVPIAKAMDRGWVTEDGKPDFAAIARHNGRRQTLVDGGKVPDPGFVSG